MEVNNEELVEVYNEKLGFNRLYTKDGCLLVLATSDGTTTNVGWSTWFTDKNFEKHALQDARVVRLFLKISTDPGVRFILEHPFFELVKKVKVVRVPKGARFQVCDMYGSETVVYDDEKMWESA